MSPNRLPPPHATGTLYTDDSQVNVIVVSKEYANVGEAARIIVTTEWREPCLVVAEHPVKAEPGFLEQLQQRRLEQQQPPSQEHTPAGGRKRKIEVIDLTNDTDDDTDGASGAAGVIDLTNDTDDDADGASGAAGGGD